MHEFRCPHCSTMLRMRDDRFRGQTIACPECGDPVLIQEMGDRLQGVAVPSKERKQLRGSPLKQPFPANPPSSPVVTTPTPSTASDLPVPTRRISREFLIGAGCAIALLLLIVLLIRPAPHKNDAVAETPASDKNEDIPSGISPAGQPHSTQEESSPGADGPAETLPAEKSTADPSSEAIREQLTGIHSEMLKTFSREGVSFEIPAQSENTPGWISQIAMAVLPREHIDWEAGWDAPVNDRFVRRRFPLFDNPNIPQKAGDDGYPASHYVGVSGVGVDAAQLDRDHPRAGIFSSIRSTRLSDVTDGLSNTMMIAGVQSRLRSWAAPGDAGIRSLTQEPYLNGPDGFGTGQSDRMLVLMADGSVREISKQTDPVIIRRMAAMADGNSLDHSHEAMPGESSSSTNGSPPPIPVLPPVLPQVAPSEQPPMREQAPIDAPLAENPATKGDFQSRLSQKIAHYDQSRPVPLRDLLWELEEISAIPFDLSALPEETLQNPITANLRNTTIEEIVLHLCRSARIDSHVGPRGLRFTPASTDDNITGDESAP